MHAKYFFFNDEKRFGCVLIMAMIMGSLLGLFFLFHVSLMVWNQTTNESAKHVPL